MQIRPDGNNHPEVKQIELSNTEYLDQNTDLLRSFRWSIIRGSTNSIDSKSEVCQNKQGGKRSNGFYGYLDYCILKIVIKLKGLKFILAAGDVVKRGV